MVELLRWRGALLIVNTWTADAAHGPTPQSRAGVEHDPAFGPAAGHGLQISIGDLAAPSGLRGAEREHQEDGICGLPYHPDLDFLWHRRPKLLLHGSLGVLQEPLAEGVVLEAPLDQPALHPHTAAATGRFAHDPFPLFRPNYQPASSWTTLPYADCNRDACVLARSLLLAECSPADRVSGSIEEQRREAHPPTWVPLSRGIRAEVRLQPYVNGSPRV